MDAVLEFLPTLKKLYSDSFIALFLFGGIFVILGGRQALKRPSEGTMNEAAHNLLLVLSNSALVVLLFGNLSFYSNFLFEYLSLPRVTKDFWSNVPFFYGIIIALIALDFQNYWAHRILHTKYFWGVHALHHSDKHITWSTSYRIHVLELVIMSVVYVTLIGWLSLPATVVAPVAFIRLWHSKLIHCQFDWTFGRFRRILASPNYHKWHHSSKPEAFGKNLCDMFPIWDIMFGTHYDPGLCGTDTGVDGFKDGFLEGQIYPFKYAYIATKKRFKSTPVTPPRTP
ncbi:sterol desaturase family protein [Hellea sp.]|nr:sterol desaturase family protein [Hellea sp.]